MYGTIERKVDIKEKDELLRNSKHPCTQPLAAAATAALAILICRMFSSI